MSSRKKPSTYIYLKQMQTMQSNLDALSSMANLSEELHLASQTIRKLANVQRSALLPTIESLLRANEHIANIARTYNSTSSLAQQTLSSHSQAMKALGQSISNSHQYWSDLSSLLSLSTHIQEQYANFANINFTLLFQTHTTSIQALLSSFSESSLTYERLWASLQRDVTRLPLLPHVITKHPSIEMYMNGRTLAVISEDSSIGIHEETEHIVQNIPGEIRASLQAINPDLVPMYDGAIDALESDRKDRTRHFAVSVRELIDHLLRQIASTEAVLQWDQDPQNLDSKGGPTRKARLRYLCKDISQGDFGAFLEADYRVFDKFFNLVQKATHEPQSNLTVSQLRVMKSRADCFIHLLLEMAVSSA